MRNCTFRVPVSQSHSCHILICPVLFVTVVYSKLLFSSFTMLPRLIMMIVTLRLKIQKSTAKKNWQNNPRANFLQASSLCYRLRYIPGKRIIGLAKGSNITTFPNLCPGPVVEFLYCSPLTKIAIKRIMF